MKIDLKTTAGETTLNGEPLARFELPKYTTECFAVGKKLVACLLTAENGYELLEYSGVVDVSKFNYEFGAKIATEKAVKALADKVSYHEQFKFPTNYLDHG